MGYDQYLYDGSGYENITINVRFLKIKKILPIQTGFQNYLVIYMILW